MIWLLFFCQIFFSLLWEEGKCPKLKKMLKVTFEGLNVLINLYTIWHMCIFLMCKYTNAKMLAQILLTTIMLKVW